MHFNYVKFDAPGTYAGKAHLLSEVIDRIETFGDDFYAKCLLSYTLKQNDSLFMKFRDAGYV